jgi:protein-tyrosine-phosphatase
MSLFHALGTRRGRVLFVCLGNSCRSQVAETLARMYAADVIEAASAGLQPASRISRRTRAAMDHRKTPILDDQAPKNITAFDLESFDLIVNLSEYALPKTETPVVKYHVPDPDGAAPGTASRNLRSHRGTGAISLRPFSQRARVERDQSAIFGGMRRGAVLPLVFLLICAAGVIYVRAMHAAVLWADDNLPLAAAQELAHGKTLYRDVWFDKPPLVAWVPLLWGARAGLLLRLAGAMYVLLAAAVAGHMARVRWGVREGLIASGLFAFFLTFGLPSAVIPLASDMLLILPHLAAIYFAWNGQAFWSGAAAGVGLLASSKAIMVLLACALWRWREAPLLLAGFVAPNAIAMAWMWAHGSLGEFYRQAWEWGGIYARNTFVENPLAEGLKRSANWMGFQAALVVGAAIALWRERDWKLTAWIVISFCGVILGLRFFPRYYFLLLPPMVLIAARGWASGWGRRFRLPVVALVVLLSVPAIRFRPGVLSRDLAIDRDSHAAGDKLRALATPGDSLFVWGFRPDIFIYSGLPAGTRFLESQPISVVLADRHLFSSQAIAPEFTAPNRAELLRARPTWVVDGLGPYNKTLSLAAQPEFAGWLGQYHEVARTDFSILYHLK